MLCRELFETRVNLPFEKGRLNIMRGSYAAFVCVMAPMDFLRLTTTSNEDIDYIMSQDSPSIEDYRDGNHPHMTRQNHYMPFLQIVYPEGKITAHEGRHRAAMVYKAGGKTFPCVLMPKLAVTYSVSYFDVIADENKEEIFKTDQEAKARRDELRMAYDDDGNELYDNIRRDTRHPDYLKGHPERSKGWDKAAWKPEDAPKQLIGQFNPSVVVTNFKAGIVKGYRHHRL